MNTCSHQSTLARGSGSVAGPAGYINVPVFESVTPAAVQHNALLPWRRYVTFFTFLSYDPGMYMYPGYP